MSARSEIFTTKGVKTLKPFLSDYFFIFFIFNFQIGVSLEIM